jgi:hypothetical protein
MGHEPIVQLVGIYMALLYGIFYRGSTFLSPITTIITRNFI